MTSDGPRPRQWPASWRRKDRCRPSPGRCGARARPRRRWEVEARIEPRVGEIPSPVEDLAARAEWLRGIMQCRWPDLAEPLQRWRDAVIEALRALSEDTIVVSHYIAINVAVGNALGDPRVTCFRPDHCSRTMLDVVDGRLVLIELGAQGATRVL
jgi:broad specificity phosphatase PhoE